jgi:hypothetical protein
MSRCLRQIPSLTMVAYLRAASGIPLKRATRLERLAEGKPRLYRSENGNVQTLYLATHAGSASSSCHIPISRSADSERLIRLYFILFFRLFRQFPPSTFPERVAMQSTLPTRCLFNMRKGSKYFSRILYPQIDSQTITSSERSSSTRCLMALALLRILW